MEQIMSVEVKTEPEPEPESDPGATLQPTTSANNCRSPKIPEKSKLRYHVTYQGFLAWQNVNNVTGIFKESVIITYFKHISETMKPNTLWSAYSMLKPMLKHYHSLDIGKYSKLIAYLKDLNKSYVPCKSKIFKAEEISKFLKEAPDEMYLGKKVIAIFQSQGRCITEELAGLKTKDIHLLDNVYLINMRGSKPGTKRVFTISDDYFQIVKKYVDLRPDDMDRFFVGFREGKCTRQPMGRNSIMQVPKKIAQYLKLEEPSRYSGQSFRKNGVKTVANICDVGDLHSLKRIETQKNSSASEDCIEIINETIRTEKNRISLLKETAPNLKRKLFEKNESSPSKLVYTPNFTVDIEIPMSDDGPVDENWNDSASTLSFSPLHTPDPLSLDDPPVTIDVSTCDEDTKEGIVLLSSNPNSPLPDSGKQSLPADLPIDIVKMEHDYNVELNDDCSAPEKGNPTIVHTVPVSSRPKETTSKATIDSSAPTAEKTSQSTSFPIKLPEEGVKEINFNLPNVKDLSDFKDALGHFTFTNCTNLTINFNINK